MYRVIRLLSVTSPLRQTLGAHLGQVLTPELAAALELAALPPVVPIDIGDFKPLRHGDYTIAIERFSDVLPELHALHVLHWQETELHMKGIPMNPDYQRMQNAESAGKLLQFTVRKDDELVGNLRMYLFMSAHTQTPYASEDTLFIKPESRGGFLVMELMRYAERVIFALGIKEIRVNSKLVNKADVLMRRMRYQPVSLEFVKFSQE